MGLADKIVSLVNRVATGPEGARRVIAPLAALVFLGLVGLAVLMGLVADWALGLPPMLDRPLGLAAGLFLCLAGLGLVAWSLAHFAGARGTPVPFNPPPRLVTSGPYALARNPMLTGVFALMFGLGFLARSFSLTLFITPLFIAFNISELKSVEEPELELRLGQEYVDYKRRTPMFLPRLGWLFRKGRGSRP